MLVVVSAPSGNQDTSLGQARKPMVIQALIPKPAVETLDEAVLLRFARLDVVPADTRFQLPAQHRPRRLRLFPMNRE